MTEPPILVVHLFSDKARKQLLQLLRTQKRPKGTKVYVGRYGINRKDAAEFSAIPAVFYAPTFHLSLDDTAEVRPKRRLPVADAKKVDPELSGPLPTRSTELLPTSNPHAWGVELGRRFRDQLRERIRQGHKIETWQLDEIPPKCVTSGASAIDFRRFVGGVVRGLAEGRPKLGDKRLRGFVWISAQGLEGKPGIPGLPKLSCSDNDVKQFWDDINAGAKCLVGEEYPDFKGNATVAANGKARAQKALNAATPGSGSRQELAKRYIVGMTPGFHEPFKKSGLNGNVNHLSLDEVATWRKAFITARCKAQRPVGYGMFSFDKPFNHRPENVENAIKALNFAAANHAKP
jgi:hypothetical protein